MRKLVPVPVFDSRLSYLRQDSLVLIIRTSFSCSLTNNFNMTVLVLVLALWVGVVMVMVMMVVVVGMNCSCQCMNMRHDYLSMQERMASDWIPVWHGRCGELQTDNASGIWWEIWCSRKTSNPSPIFQDNSCQTGGIEIIARDQHPGIKLRGGNFS